LSGKIVQLLARCGRAREQRSGTAPQVLAHILQIVSQLQQCAPLERQPAFLLAEPAMRKASIRQHRCSALGAAYPQHFGVIAIATVIKLRDAQLLRAMDGPQALKHLGVTQPRVLFFDQLNHRPHRRFAMVPHFKSPAA
jgi:hypothetical protein